MVELIITKLNKDSRIMFFDLFKSLKFNLILGKFTLGSLKFLERLAFLKQSLDLNFLKVRGMFGNIHLGIDGVYDVFNFLKKARSLQCVQLLDIVCVDLLALTSNVKRFELIYVLLSPVYNLRFFLHSYIKLFEVVGSIVKIYTTADWLEREVFDMFGVIFKNHPNLRRILTDYGFKGHPGRKDFPLTGYSELRYDDSFETIVNDPLELAQEFRFFKLEDTWNYWNKRKKTKI